MGSPAGMPSQGHELSSAEAKHSVKTECRWPQGLVLILEIRHLEANAPNGSAEEMVKTVHTEKPVEKEARAGRWGGLLHLVEEGLL